MALSAADPQCGVQVRDLVVGYGGKPVLTGANITVARRQVVAVLGRSGAGKTTLLRCIAGFVRPTSGSITLAGHVVSDRRIAVPPERRDIGLVPQEGALFPHLDVAGNIGFGLPRRTREQRAAARQRVAELLDFVSLSGKQRVRPHELSGGMQQRVALARALARSPHTVLLDEPFSSLDAGLRRELRMQVRELLLQTDAAVILVTHDEDEARVMADRIQSIDSGVLSDYDPNSAQP